MTPAPDSALTPQQHRIISLLAQGRTITETAELENLHRNTITNWRRTNPVFAQELDLTLSEQRHYWQEQATRLAPLAMQAIEDCLTNPNSSPSLRFRAATYIMKIATAKTAQVPNHAQPPTDVQTQEAELMPRTQQLGSIVPRESAQSAAKEPAQSCTKPQPIRVTPKPGRNDECPCGSNQKYKRCCINKAA